MAVYYPQIALKQTIAPETLAAITAAIAVYIDQETDWKIASIQPARRATNRWVMAGRTDLMRNLLTLERRRLAG
ncbi:MAG: hypothetical protein PWQ18_1028 [Clostridia bacterium]|nr:hypothetical protein [Clostridia bacterium]